MGIFFFFFAVHSHSYYADLYCVYCVWWSMGSELEYFYRNKENLFKPYYQFLLVIICFIFNGTVSVKYTGQFPFSITLSKLVTMIILQFKKKKPVQGFLIKYILTFWRNWRQNTHYFLVFNG